MWKITNQRARIKEAAAEENGGIGKGRFSGLVKRENDPVVPTAKRRARERGDYRTSFSPPASAKRVRLITRRLIGFLS